MSTKKPVKAITIKDTIALKLLSERAANERRSVTSAAIITILESLGPGSNDALRQSKNQEFTNNGKD
jgi:hypothetical protein